MFRRAKISALITLVGVVTASAAPLNPEQKNTAFQPGARTGANLSKATIVKPASLPTWGKSHRWSGVKVQHIAPAPQATAPVEINGVAFRKTSEAAAPQPTVQPAGGNR